MTLSPVTCLPRSAATLAVLMLTITAPLSASAGFLDSIYDVQNTISSIGRTADTIRGSKQAVSNLGEEVGFIGQASQNANSKLESGSMLAGKLQKTNLYSQANGSSSAVAVLSQDDSMVYMGNEQNGYYYVHSDKGQGWVAKPLVNIR